MKEYADYMARGGEYIPNSDEGLNKGRGMAYNHIMDDHG